MGLSKRSQSHPCLMMKTNAIPKSCILEFKNQEDMNSNKLKITVIERRPEITFRILCKHKSPVVRWNLASNFVSQVLNEHFERCKIYFQCGIWSREFLGIGLRFHIAHCLSTPEVNSSASRIRSLGVFRFLTFVTDLLIP